MKILQLITSLRTGGAEKLITDMAPRLRALGHEVDVAVFDGVDTPFKRQLETEGIPVVSLGRWVYSPLHIARLVRLMRRYDLVHTHNTSPQLYAALANVFVGTRLVTTEHNTNNRRRGIPLLYGMDRWMYGRYSRIVCISDRARECLCDYMPSCRPRVTTIYNGVDVNAFRHAQPLEGLPYGGRKVAVMVAGFRPQKDQDTLIRALSHMDDESWEVWLVGDGERRAALGQLASDLKLDRRVRFMGVRTDIPQLLHLATVVVMSSHYEGLSLSSIEGMSVGLPFVASDVDGLHEMVAGAGILFPEGDDRALARILTELGSDAVKRQAVADACWQKARQFDITETVSKYNNLYQEIL